MYPKTQRFVAQDRLAARDLAVLSWDDLRLFGLVAREGGIRRTAGVLQVSAPTVTRRIARLERLLRHPLFFRTGGRMTLTPEGTKTVAVVEAMERSASELRRFVDSDPSQRGTIKFAVTEGVGTYWVLPRLIVYQHANPSTVIDLTCTMSSTDVLRLEADLAIQYVRADNPDLISVKLGRIHVALFASRKYLQAHGTPRTVAELEQHVLIDQRSKQTPAGILAGLLKKQNIEGALAIRTNTSSAHYYAIDEGGGIGLLPTYAVALGADVVPLELDVSASEDLWLTYHPDLKSTPRITRFVSWLRSIFSPATNPWFRDEYISPHDLQRMEFKVTRSAINAVTHPGLLADDLRRAVKKGK